MFDVACLSDPTVHQRAVGELRVSFKRRGEATVLDGLRQAGCLKARFPNCATPGWLDATMLNTGGGVVGGDRLDLAFSAGVDTRVTVAAQAAERFYRALPDSAPSRVQTTVAVAAGAAFEWLPQETILYDRCALERRLDIELAADACFLGVESLVFGRTAMGESVESGWLRDTVRVRRAGALLLHDAIRLNGPIASMLARPAVGAGARAVATLIYVAPDAEQQLDAVRSATDAGECGVSAWNGMLLARILAPDGASLRGLTMAALAVLRAPRPLPRVWLC